VTFCTGSFLADSNAAKPLGQAARFSSSDY